MNKRLFLVVWVCLILLLLLSNCGKSDFPAGRYIREIGGDILVYTSDGEFTLDGVNHGFYTIENNMLTWEKDEICDRTGEHKEATYKLTLEKDVLTFELVGEDKCLEREAMLVRSNWLKQEE
jgi:hypothetical protein